MTWIQWEEQYTKKIYQRIKKIFLSQYTILKVHGYVVFGLKLDLCIIFSADSIICYVISKLNFSLYKCGNLKFAYCDIY